MSQGRRRSHGSRRPPGRSAHRGRRRSRPPADRLSAPATRWAPMGDDRTGPRHSGRRCAVPTMVRWALPGGRRDRRGNPGVPHPHAPLATERSEASTAAGRYEIYGRPGIHGVAAHRPGSRSVSRDGQSARRRYLADGRGHAAATPASVRGEHARHAEPVACRSRTDLEAPSTSTDLHAAGRGRDRGSAPGPEGVGESCRGPPHESAMLVGRCGRGVIERAEGVAAARRRPSRSTRSGDRAAPSCERESGHEADDPSSRDECGDLGSDRRPVHARVAGFRRREPVRGISIPIRCRKVSFRARAPARR